MTTNSQQIDPILRVDNLRTWFPVKRGIFSRTVGYVKAVNNVSLYINPGETLGLVGESGCGKTTLGRTIAGLENARGGTMSFNGRPLHNRRDTGFDSTRRQIQIIFQDPFSSLNPRMTILDIITEGMVHHGLIQKKQRIDAAVKLIHDVGLDENAIYRFPHEFSGGQRQRISIARAVSVRPELIVCDEAVSALDVSVQAQVINLLLDLRDKYNLSYLFISHDLSVVRLISDRVAVMYLGHIVEQGRTDDVISNPRHPYAQALVSSIPIPGKSKSDRAVLIGEIPSPSNPPSGCPFHTRCTQVMDICRKEFPASRLIENRQLSCHLY